MNSFTPGKMFESWSHHLGCTLQRRLNFLNCSVRSRHACGGTPSTFSLRKTRLPRP